ncbi:MAG: type VII secretion protein EccCa [Pseudonocardia sp.]|nr:type VII secretion protein EccCa [Pseudonocardia sp.]
MPAGELPVESPPEPERTVPGGIVNRVVPAATMLGSIGFIAVMGVDNPTSWLFGGMFALSSIGMLVSGAGRGDRTATLDEDRRDYLRYLGLLRGRVRAVAAAQRVALESAHPHPSAWPAVLAAGRLWERRASDEDHLRLRVGVGAQRLATRLGPPHTGPVDGLEPVTALALRRFLVRHTVVPDLPVAVDLAAGPTGAALWVEGEERSEGEGPVDLGPARALARALVVQYALWHSPADALLAVVASSSAIGGWEWVKWLPHNAHPRRADALGPIRMITSDGDDVRRWWLDEGAGGSRNLLLIVDGAASPGAWASSPGVTVVRIGAPPGRRAAPSVVRLRVGPARLGGPEGQADHGVPDAVGPAEALAFARRLARYRPAESDWSGQDGSAGPEDTGPDRPAGLPELLGLSGGIGPEEVGPLRRRWREAPVDRLRVPLGLDSAGRPVLLDLKESAQGGSGPHGLCVGATGSGKSELLRTLVLGLVATHSPEELNLVLVDFKGGATFLDLAGLPHVSAVITNLADELTLVDRMADALAGEITRRQELLRAAGNLAGVVEYTAARAAGAPLEPLPVLLIVVDEFSELLARRPELVDLLVQIGRLGRSLGLHLLLASQRLDEGRLRGLESHLSYRIALRTFSASESRAVLGVPDAHRLPPAPGSAFLSTGTDELVRFRAAYVSGPVTGGPAPVPGVRRARVFGIAPVTDEPVALPAAGSTRSVLDEAVTALAGRGPRAHRVWLPPLDVPPPLATVLAEHPGGRLRVPVGLVDRPYLQRRDPLVLDLSGAAGHVAVAGGPRSGKSTALRTLVTALAATHGPTELGVHVIDAGGGGLAAVAALPNVGTVAGRQEPDLVRRTVAEVTGLLERREELFRTAGLTSVEEFRARRAAGDFPAETATDVLLVIDGYPSFRADFEAVEATLLPIASRGLGFGVHLALSAGRWTEIRPALKDLLGSRIELRLGEPSDSEVDRRRAAGVPRRPGHGLAQDAAPMLIAAPDGVRLVEAAEGEAFPPVRLLPAEIPVAALPVGTGLGIGVDEERLELVELDPIGEAHLLCFADAESGKTSLLRLLGNAVAARWSPEQARIVVVDHRRGLLGAVPDSHLLEFCGTAEATAQAAADLAESLRLRLPGADTTPRALRERSWWTGPDVWLLVDDYDLVAPSGAAGPHPLLPLLEFLPQARDVGLHVVIARRSGGAGRALFDPVLGRLRELGAPGLVMNGSPDEGSLVGSAKPSPMPPGRALLVDRRGTRRVQLAWCAPEEG